MNKKIAGVIGTSGRKAMEQMFQEALEKGTRDCDCGEKIEEVKAKVGDQDLTGQLVLGISITNQGDQLKVLQALEGHSSPIELIGMIEALDVMRKKLIESLVTATVSDVFGIDPPDEDGEPKHK